MADEIGAAAGRQAIGVIAGRLRMTGIALGKKGFTLSEAQLIEQAVEKFNQVIGGPRAALIATGGVSLWRTNKGGGLAYPFFIFPMWKLITLSEGELHQDPEWRGQVAVVHELAHEWDAQSANWFQRAFGGGGRIVREMIAFVGDEPGPTCYGGLMAKDCTFKRVPVEEWAESVAAYVFPEYIEWLRENMPSEREAGLHPKHKQYVEMQIEKLRKLL